MSQILLVEDNEADAFVVKQCFEDLDASIELTVVSDGVEALDVLLNPDEADRYRPDLVLLDLNLPGRHGKDVLRELRDDTRTRVLPIIILSSSAQDADIDSCYDLSANAYMTKSMTLDDTRASLDALQKFWLKNSALPTSN